LAKVGIVRPALLEGEVEHGIARIPGHFFDNFQEFGKSLLKFFSREGAVGLEQNKPLAPAC